MAWLVIYDILPLTLDSFDIWIKLWRVINHLRFCLVKCLPHFATGLPAAAVPTAFDKGAAKENCGSNFLCITAAAAALQAVLQAPRRGEIPRVQIADLCEGCISLSNAEGLENGLLNFADIILTQ